jgi:hypothetical protein
MLRDLLNSLDDTMNPTKTRIVLIGLGSRGDLQPYVGLALTLRQRGYRVKVYTYKSFSKYVASFGLDYYELDFDIEWEIRNNEHVLNALWKGDPFAFMEAVTKMQTPEWYRRLFVPLVADVAAFAPALVLTNFTAHWLSLNLAEMHGIPSCYTHLHPMVPSAQFPSMLWDAFGINTPCCGCHELGHLLQRKLGALLALDPSTPGRPLAVCWLLAEPLLTQRPTDRECHPQWNPASRGPPAASACCARPASTSQPLATARCPQSSRGRPSPGSP